MHSKILKASTRIKTYLKAFFSILLNGKLGKNTRHGPETLAQAHHQMICSGASLSATAKAMGLAHTTLTRKLQQPSLDDVGAALSKVTESMLRVRKKLFIVDFTHLEYAGKELLNLTTGTIGGQVFKVLSAACGKVICYLAHKSMLDFKEDLLWELIQHVGSGRVLVADGEFSTKKCMKRLWKAVDQGLIQGFVVRGNPRWHRILYRFQGSPIGWSGRIKLWGRWVWVYKVKLGRDTGYLLSSSEDLGPGEYRVRWAIEVYFRDAKDLMPKVCFHTLEARLAVFSSCIIASAVLRLLQVSKGLWRSCIISMALQALAVVSRIQPMLKEGKSPPAA